MNVTAKKTEMCIILCTVFSASTFFMTLKWRVTINQKNEMLHIPFIMRFINSGGEHGKIYPFHF